MRVVTALRAGPRGRVVVELDGAPWRTFPLEPVVRAGLEPGIALDRPRLRVLAQEVRRARAATVAARALARRELSTRGLDARLGRAGVAPAVRAETVAAATRGGLVDDARYAVARAQSLAERERGDAAIRWELEREGVTPALVERALEALEPERDRAARLVAARGAGAATARYLARRGFDEDTVEASAGAGV